eukprot:m.48357 g.48357  ORF g.48357 m.48357 type:complete len:398 (-) comp11991_c0_seq2:57-1250(-)
MASTDPPAAAMLGDELEPVASQQEQPDAHKATAATPAVADTDTAATAMETAATTENTAADGTAAAPDPAAAPDAAAPDAVDAAAADAVPAVGAAPVRAGAGRMEPGEINGFFESAPATLAGPDPQARFECITRVRRLLSREDNPPIRQCIDSGLLPHLVRLLGDPVERTIFESAWAVTNLLSGTSEDCAHVVAAGAVPVLDSLIRSPNEDIAEQVVWAMGNLTGDGPEHRDCVLKLPHTTEFILEVMGDAVGTTRKISMVRNCAWAMGNFVRSQPPPPEPIVKRVCETAFHILSSALDPEVAVDTDVLVDSTWSLHYVCSNPEYVCYVNDLAGEALATAVFLEPRNFRNVVLRTLTRLAPECGLHDPDGKLHAWLEENKTEKFVRELIEADSGPPPK